MYEKNYCINVTYISIKREISIFTSYKLLYVLLLINLKSNKTYINSRRNRRYEGGGGIFPSARLDWFTFAIIIRLSYFPDFKHTCLQKYRAPLTKYSYISSPPHPPFMQTCVQSLLHSSLKTIFKFCSAGISFLKALTIRTYGGT